tara:strand:+ start:25743 stop:25964 length:222 start_codon:yes stop_codon:yes gene_type:complete
MDKTKDPKFPLEVLKITDNPDGTADINLDVSDEFQAWFKEKQGLKRWSKKRFEQWVIKSLKLYKENSNEDDQS